MVSQNLKPGLWRKLCRVFFSRIHKMRFTRFRAVLAFLFYTVFLLWFATDTNEAGVGGFCFAAWIMMLIVYIKPMVRGEE